MIDYEQEVKKVYPEATINGDVDIEDNTLLWWVEDGEGNTISDIFDEFQSSAWQSAYDNLKKDGKL